jgi:uridine kinase
MARADLATDLARVAELIPDHSDACVIVGIDGVDGAGKTTFADALAAALDRPVVRISVDDFHQPEKVRYRRGRDSAAGFWLDAFDYERLNADVFRPLRAERRYRPAARDLRTDQALDVPWQTAPPGAVVVFLDVPFEVAGRRLHKRDGVRPLERYVGASLLYFAQCDPIRNADLVIDNG